MLKRAVFSVSALHQGSVFGPWGYVGVCGSSVTAYFKARREKVGLCRKSSRNIWVFWFDIDSLASTLVAEGAPRTGVRISNIVEVGNLR